MHFVSAVLLVATVISTPGMIAAVAAAVTLRPMNASQTPGTVTTVATTTNGPNHAIADPNDTSIYFTQEHSVNRIPPGSTTAELIAGSTTASGSDNGIGAAASFLNPVGIAQGIRNRNLLLISDYGNHCLRTVHIPTRTVATLAGLCGPSNHGDTDATGTAARFYRPSGIAIALVRSNGSSLEPPLEVLYVADYSNSRIRRVDVATGAVTTFALSGDTTSFGPLDIVMVLDMVNAADGGSGVLKWLLVGDISSNRVRIVTVATNGAGGVMTTFAGNGSAGYQDGVGRAAMLNGPFGIAVEVDPSISATTRGDAVVAYVADYDNCAIRRANTGGVVATVSGGGLSKCSGTGLVDGNVSEARFKNPGGVQFYQRAINGSSGGVERGLLVADLLNKAIRRVVLRSRTVASASTTISSSVDTPSVSVSPQSSHSAGTDTGQRSATASHSSQGLTASLSAIVPPHRATLSVVAATIDALSGVTAGVIGVATLTGTAASAMVSASSVLHLQASMSAVRIQLRCASAGGSDAEPSSDTEEDFIGSSLSDNPARARVDAMGARSAYAGGAVLSNAALVVGIAIISAAVALLLSDRCPPPDATRGPPSTRTTARPPLRIWWRSIALPLPGYAAATFAALLQPSIAASVLSIVVAVPEHDMVAGVGGNVALRVFVGVVGCAMHGGYFAGVAWGIIGRFPLHAHTTPQDAPAAGASNDCGPLQVARWCRQMTAPHDAWAGPPQHEAFQQRYHPVFECYRRNCHWTFAVEWASAVLLGLLDALSAAEGGGGPLCEASVWCVLAVNVGLAGFALWRLPYNTPLDNAINALQCIATVTVSVLCASDLVEPAAYLALAQGVVTLLCVVLSGAWGICWRLQNCIASHRVVFVQASTTAVARGHCRQVRRQKQLSNRQEDVLPLALGVSQTHYADNANSNKRRSDHHPRPPPTAVDVAAVIAAANVGIAPGGGALQALVQLICDQQRF